MAENVVGSKSKRRTQGSVFIKAAKQSKRSARFKKFIGNKTEGQGFADKRKKKVQYEYLKTLKKERSNKRQNAHSFLDDEGFTAGQSRQWKGKGMYKNKMNANRFTKVKGESQKRREIENKKAEEAMRRKQERDEALQKYNSKKKENFKKLCKKTHKGQPVMKNQIEYLLAKIEKEVNQT